MSELENNSTICIVGAGSIALCTAYNLSKAGNENRIIVIEAFDRPFPAASSACTGCFHYSFPETLNESLDPLGKFSFNLWEAEANKPDFKIATGYRAQSSYGVKSGNGEDLQTLPNWVNSKPDWSVDKKVLGEKTATVNPPGVGKWLAMQCLANGVEILTDSKVVSVELSSESQVKSVTLLAGDQKEMIIPCTQVLLACGPWTPSVYAQLFPHSPIQLQWTINAGDWIILKNPCLTTLETTAFVSFGPLIGDKFEFAGRNDGTIWACGRRNLEASLPPVAQYDNPDECLIQEMCDLAKKWIKWGCTCDEIHGDQFQLLKKGRAFRPATKSGLPVIAEVKTSDICKEGTGAPTGVFICWGHGSWGLTLGMGSGRLMSQVMRGEQPEIDISPFCLSKNTETVKL